MLFFSASPIWRLLDSRQCVLLCRQMLMKPSCATCSVISNHHLSKTVTAVSSPALPLWKRHEQAQGEVHRCHSAYGQMESNKPCQKLHWEAESLQWKVGVPGFTHFLIIMNLRQQCTRVEPGGGRSTKDEGTGATGQRVEAILGTPPGGPIPGSKG